MAERLFEILRGYFSVHGYWTVALALLLENAGVPVPGETILLFASFLAFSEHALALPYIILVAIAAATLGDNIGYLIGHHGGRPLLERWRHLFHLSEAAIRRGERLFRRHGSLTIFFARFVFGMRVIAGPLAGVLRMPWKSFAVFNLLGASVWVTVISLAGYFFGQHWDKLVRVIKRIDTGILIIAAGLILWAWLRFRRSRAARGME